MSDFTTTSQRIVRVQGQGQPLETLFVAKGVPPLSPPDSLPEGTTPGSILALHKTGWEQLAHGGTARALLFQILAQKGVNPLFPEAVRQETQQWLQNPGLQDPNLVDLTTLAFITIDNDDSRDLDQALHIARPPEQEGFLVYYALADASYYVRPGSALFGEALRRGASYYLPQMSASMLPPELSEGLISLNPSVNRRALVFQMHLDATGINVDTKIFQGLIHSRAKLTYNGVQRYHDTPKTSPLHGHDYTETLDLLRTVGELRIADAARRDVVRYDRARIAVSLSGDRVETFGARREERNDVERWNEQISLLCNAEGSYYLRNEAIENRHIQPIFRVHGAPQARHLTDIQAKINQLIHAHGLDAKTWCWKAEKTASEPESESVAEYLERVPRGGEHRRIRMAIERQFLLANQRSNFSEEASQHFALGVSSYSRVSAPMREVVGIFTHKEALEKPGDGATEAQIAADEALREKIIAAAHRSKSLQRQITKEVQKLAIDHLFEHDLELSPEERPRRTGTICGLKSTRIFVHLDNPPMELKVYLEDVSQALGCTFHYERHNVEMHATDPDMPPLRIGDELVLYIGGYDQDKKRWLLLPDFSSHNHAQS